jgi:hypothetical protein
MIIAGAVRITFIIENAFRVRQIWRRPWSCMATPSAVKDAMSSKPTSKAEIARRIRLAGERAKAEAEARRAALAKLTEEKPAEIGGPKGPEPTRYGDWERKGIVSDF